MLLKSLSHWIPALRTLSLQDWSFSDSSLLGWTGQRGEDTRCNNINLLPSIELSAPLTLTPLRYRMRKQLLLLIPWKEAHAGSAYLYFIVAR